MFKNQEDFRTTRQRHPTLGFIDEAEEVDDEEVLVGRMAERRSRNASLSPKSLTDSSSMSLTFSFFKNNFIGRLLYSEDDFDVPSNIFLNSVALGITHNIMLFFTELPCAGGNVKPPPSKIVCLLFFWWRWEQQMPTRGLRVRCFLDQSESLSICKHKTFFHFFIASEFCSQKSTHKKQKLPESESIIQCKQMFQKF